MTWPIFNGFLTTHQVEEARLHQQAIEHATKDLQQRVILQVKTAFFNWESSRQEIQRARAHWKRRKWNWNLRRSGTMPA